MNPDHIVGPNEMIGRRPTAADHFGGFTEMVETKNLYRICGGATTE